MEKQCCVCEVGTKNWTKLRDLYSASELYRPSDRRLSAKLVPPFADRGCRVVSATDPLAVNSVFLTREVGTELLNIILTNFVLLHSGSLHLLSNGNQQICWARLVSVTWVPDNLHARNVRGRWLGTSFQSPSATQVSDELKEQACMAA
jgi:hypothetical protein